MLVQIKDDPCFFRIDGRGYMRSILRNVEAVTDGFHNFFHLLKVSRPGIVASFDKDDQINRVCFEKQPKVSVANRAY